MNLLLFPPADPLAPSPPSFAAALLVNLWVMRDHPDGVIPVDFQGHIQGAMSCIICAIYKQTQTMRNIVRVERFLHDVESRVFKKPPEHRWSKVRKMDFSGCSRTGDSELGTELLKRSESKPFADLLDG